MWSQYAWININRDYIKQLYCIKFNHTEKIKKDRGKRASVTLSTKEFVERTGHTSNAI